MFLTCVLLLVSSRQAWCQCSGSACLPEDYNRMDFPPSQGPVVVNTTILLLDIFEVHTETFTLDLSLYIKLEWMDNRLNVTEEATVNVDQSTMV